jgi:transposase
MHYVKETSRDQLALFPEALEDYVSGNNPVHFIDRFVETLDLVSLGFKHARLGKTGRPPYSPGALLRLYIYGYLYQHRSTRQLARQTHCNVEVIWLLRKLQPDFKTIANFRRENGQSIRLVVSEFRRLCRALELYGRELVAIDGSYFKASNSRSRHISRTGLDKDLAALDEQIAGYLLAMDEADAGDEGETLSEAALSEKLSRLEKLQARRAKKQGQRDSLEASGESQRCLSDRDARLLKKGSKTVIGYNVQIGVDDKHHLIAAHAVTSEGNDQGQLTPMAKQVKAALGVEEIEAVADAGYHTRDDLRLSAEAGVTTYVASYDSSTSKAHGRYSKSDFDYDAKEDVYRCPAGEVMSFVGTGRDKTGHLLRYYRARGCGECGLRDRCLKPDVPYRRISRWEHEAIVEANAARVEAREDMMTIRMSLAEHPFGSFKHWMGAAHFLTRGMPRVKTEMSLMELAYNLKRALKVLGVARLIEGLNQRVAAV